MRPAGWLRRAHPSPFFVLDGVRNGFFAPAELVDLGSEGAFNSVFAIPASSLYVAVICGR